MVNAGGWDGEWDGVEKERERDGLGEGEVGGVGHGGCGG